MSDPHAQVTLQARRICQQRMTVPEALITRAQALQGEALTAHQLLWECIKGGQLLGYAFRPQLDLGAFVADFYCESAQIVIEIGDDISRRDRCPICDCWARAHGFRILRLHHREVESNIEQVLNVLLLTLRLCSSPCLSDEDTSSPSQP
jgi:very-short-patch-repair endonuclease